jgi:hypothetical protein
LRVCSANAARHLDSIAASFSTGMTTVTVAIHLIIFGGRWSPAGRADARLREPASRYRAAQARLAASTTPIRMEFTTVGASMLTM